jgi:hypothetical protein
VTLIHPNDPNLVLVKRIKAFEGEHVMSSSFSSFHHYNNNNNSNTMSAISVPKGHIW